MTFYYYICICKGMCDKETPCIWELWKDFGTYTTVRCEIKRCEYPSYSRFIDVRKSFATNEPIRYFGAECSPSLNIIGGKADEL